VPVTVQTRTAIPPNRAFDIVVPIDLSLVRCANSVDP
jgi:hypothetical protein